MNKRNSIHSTNHTQPTSNWLRPSVKVPLLAGALLLGGVEASLAVDVKLKTTDAAGTSSFTVGTNWSNNALPSAGNAYYTTNFTLRTPNPTTSGNNYVFGGD